MTLARHAFHASRQRRHRRAPASQEHKLKLEHLKTHKDAAHKLRAQVDAGQKAVASAEVRAAAAQPSCVGPCRAGPRPASLSITGPPPAPAQAEILQLQASMEAIEAGMKDLDAKLEQLNHFNDQQSKVCQRRGQAAGRGSWGLKAPQSGGSCPAGVCVLAECACVLAPSFLPRLQIDAQLVILQRQHAEQLARWEGHL
jgi:hypothetical protein